MSLTWHVESGKNQAESLSRVENDKQIKIQTEVESEKEKKGEINL